MTNPPPPPAIPPPPPPSGQPPPPPPGEFGQPGRGHPDGWPGAVPAQPGGVASGQLAGFGVRLGGYLLDGLLYGLLYLPFLIAGFVFLGMGLDDCVTLDGDLVCDGREQPEWIATGVAVWFVGFVIVVLVYLRGLARFGQTWGRRIVSIKVVDSTTGAPPGWGKAIGRSLFAGFISSYVFYLGYLWMLWDDQNQTWHDKVAGTYVVRD